MKKITFAFIPLLLAGFMIPNDRCSNKSTQKNSIPGNDGPYILYKDNQVFIKYIGEKDGATMVREDSIPLSKKTGYIFEVNTDILGKTFPVLLKDQLKNEKTGFNGVKKQFVLSDIEGNFGAFRKLLQANQVIDTNYNWTFGTGHLVLTGDFFDRGNQVTEVLWLIYSLEDKAKAAGGYVHFILGNHEIMNLSGDLRYLNAKYVSNTILLNQPYVTLYGENSELGRWLRTKNIIEKVGDNLYTHGGISADINRMDISLATINELARPYYADSLYNYTDKRNDTIYGEQGPFWYRGYYKNVNAAIPQQIDSTLTLFHVKHIATGHTIVADTVSVWYNGKLFDTDVHHAEGKSEALLIEGDQYYRVNAFGEKFLILDN